MATSSSADMHWPSTRTLMGRRGRQNTQRQLLGATSSSADPTWKIGGWKQYPTHDPEEIHNSDWANNIYVSLKEDIQTKWRRQGPPPTKDLSLGGLSAYKYDDLRTDNAYIGFFFLRIRFSDDSYLYARAGLTRTDHCSPDLMKVSNIEADIYKT